ncbi:MAG: DnaJ domain-containing protein [Geminicoccaceae bacterium]
MNPFLAGLILLSAIGLGLYAFVNLHPAILARMVRTFAATFALLASTGLLLAGRFGLAIIAVGATIMALRTLRSSAGSRTWGAGSWGDPSGGQHQSGKSSEIRTDTLAMTLDHQSGDLDGEVLTGPFAGRSMASLGLQDLLQLLADCQRDDPRSVPLLETYLDRHQPEWRDHVTGDGARDGWQQEGEAPEGTMDEATARSILNVSPHADADEIKAAHRRLMNKFHPDHGGSSYLAAQLNQAKDVLLGR